jgi:protease YdgD
LTAAELLTRGEALLRKNRISADAQNLLGSRFVIRKFFAVIGVTLLVASTAFAEDQNQSNTSQTSSGELVVPVKKYPWSAIGKLNNGVFGSCTGVLISQNYALTAAHCLFYRTVNRFLPSASRDLIIG